MHTDTAAVDSPKDQLIYRINDALLRAELVRALRNFQSALKEWQRPEHWGELPDDFLGGIYHEGGDSFVPLVLIGSIGIDPEDAKNAILDDQELSEEERKGIDEEVSANTAWPGYALDLIVEAEMGSDFISQLLNRHETPPQLVAAFDRIVDLHQRHYEGRRPSHCLDDTFNSHGDLEQLIEAQSRMTVQLYRQVVTLTGSQYHAVVERAPHWEDDEYEFLQHTEVRVTLLNDAQPIARLTLVAEIDAQNRPFSDGDYYNFKDSMDGQSASFAEMLIERLADGEFDADSIFEMLRFYEGEPSHNAFLHLHNLEFWQTDIAPGLAAATMLQAAIRAVTEPGASDLMTAPMDTPLENLLETDFTASPYEPLPVEWPALCERVAQVFILDPFIDLDEILASSGLSEREKSDYHAQQIAARDAYSEAGQYLRGDLGERVHLVNPERTDFYGEMLRLAKHNRR